jgi:hypothetical protein
MHFYFVISSFKITRIGHGNPENNLESFIIFRLGWGPLFPGLLYSLNARDTVTLFLTLRKEH